jgi:hypothetical protein
MGVQLPPEAMSPKSRTLPISRGSTKLYIQHVAELKKMKFNWCNEAWDTLKNIEAIVLRSRDVVLSRWLRLVVDVVSKSIADKKGAYVVFLLPAACLESRTR